MNREQFVHRHSASWKQLESLLDDLERNKAAPREASGFPALYRRVCQHLALARRRHYGVDLEEQLNSLALRGHHQLYRDRPTSIMGVVEFLTSDFPRLVRQHAGLFWLATLLFYGPGLAMAALVYHNPDAIHTILAPEQVEQFEEMYHERDEEERGADTDLAMFGFYINNNISIAFRTYGGGILAGLGTIFFLTFNGLYMGAVFAHLIQAGSGERLLSFVVTHGAFELTGIVISGVAGLKLGWAVVGPGRLTRSEALKQAGPDSVRLIFGVAAMLLVAAFLEAFWSSIARFPASLKYLSGAVAWTFVGVYLYAGGRRDGA